MEKKITVYVVREVVKKGDEVEAVEGGKSKVCPTKSRSKDVVEILTSFGLEVAVFTEKRVVTL